MQLGRLIQSMEFASAGTHTPGHRSGHPVRVNSHPVYHDGALIVADTHSAVTG